MSDGPGHLACEHGYQRRVCPHCELAAAYETIARCDAYERTLTAAVARLTAERDAARAVVEDVDAALDHGIDDAEDGLWPCGASRGEAIRRLRAEVERLRSEGPQDWHHD